MEEEQRAAESDALAADPIDWNALITLQEAATLSNLSDAHLRHMIAQSRLRTVRKGKMHLTTRRWLDDFLRERDRLAGQKKRRGPQPKPLPERYQAPPRRGRPPRPTVPRPSVREGDAEARVPRAPAP